MQDLNDKVTGNSLTAAEWNQVPSEIQNVIEGLGITLSGGDLNQLGKAIAGYVANGQFYVDSGAADAYVLAPVGSKQAPPAYTDGFKIAFLATNVNTGASTVNVGGLGVKNITDRYGNALLNGDVPTSIISTAYYDASAGEFVLDTWDFSPQLFSIDTAPAANALTISLDPTVIEFRSTTLTNGTPVRRVVPSTISTVISSGSTGGTVNGVQARFAVLAIDNAGTVELAWTNLAGGINLDETTLISTTAEGGAGGADSANVIYSTTARSNVAFRVVGFFDITEATAGTWASDATLKQGAGGNAITALQSLGYGQTWQDITGSRAYGVTYYNTTGRPIEVAVGVSSTAIANISMTINGASVVIGSISNTAVTGFGTVIIPPGASYAVTITSGTPTLVSWFELR